MDITRILNVTGLVGKSSPAGWWLSLPLWKIKSDWIIIPTIGENQIHVPNHQPVYIYPTTINGKDDIPYMKWTIL